MHRNHSVIASSRHIHILLLFFAHIPFVVNYALKAMQPRGCNSICIVVSGTFAAKMETTMFVSLSGRCQVSPLVDLGLGGRKQG